MRINAGKFNKKIVLQKCVSTFDENNSEIIEWKDCKTMFASINGLYGAEYWAAATHGQEDTIIFTIRWCKFIDELAKTKALTQYRIVRDNINYEIKSYDNVEFANKIVKIKAVCRENY